MSEVMQLYFKDLPEACLIQPDIIQPELTPPVLTSLSGNIFLKHTEGNYVTDLSIQNATLKCEVLRLENDLLSRNSQLDQEKSTIATLEDNLRLELRNHRKSEEDSGILLQKQLETLTRCERDLVISEEKYSKMCLLEQESKERCDNLTHKEVLSAAELRRKSDEFSSTLRDKENENGTLERKLSEVLSEKAIIEESFRLFKSTILNDLDKEGENSTTDNHLMIKIRLLQEYNAQLSAEVKCMTRKCIDADVEVAAVKEEISLSDRMKSRLSSSVENQCKEIDVLEQKLLLANKLMLQEQAAREELKETGRSLELQLIQSKFSHERLENSIIDLKETKDTLEKALAEQM